MSNRQKIQVQNNIRRMTFLHVLSGLVIAIVLLTDDADAVSCNSALVCLTCDATNTNCASCSPGLGLNSGKNPVPCEACASNCFKCNTNLPPQCDSGGCLAGYGLTPTKTCAVCASNCALCTLAGQCDTCNSNYVVNSGLTCDLITTTMQPTTTTTTMMMTTTAALVSTASQLSGGTTAASAATSTGNCSVANCNPGCCAGTTCKSCATGYGLTASTTPTCQQCAAGCAACFQVTQCAVCNSVMPGYPAMGPMMDGSGKCGGCSGFCLSCAYSGAGKCDYCRAGTGPAPGGTCGPCADNCMTCAARGQFKCDLCLTGYTLNATASTSATFCKPTSTVSGQVEIAIEDSRTGCAGFCKTCSMSGSGRCDECQIGNGPTLSGKCGPCADNCDSCSISGQNKCDRCMAGYGLNNQAETRQDWCKSLYSRPVVETAVIQCTVPGCLTASCSGTQCTGCISGKGLTSASPPACQACSTDCAACTYVSQCTICKPSTTGFSVGPKSDGSGGCGFCAGYCDDCSTNGANKCDTCSAGGGLAPGQTCGPCALNCQTCIYQDQCSVCNTGFTLNSAATQSPTSTTPKDQWCLGGALPTTTAAVVTTTRAQVTTTPPPVTTTAAAATTTTAAQTTTTKPATTTMAAATTTMAAATTTMAAATTTMAAATTTMAAATTTMAAATTTMAAATTTMAAQTTTLKPATTTAAGGTTAVGPTTTAAPPVNLTLTCTASCRIANFLNSQVIAASANTTNTTCPSSGAVCAGFCLSCSTAGVGKCDAGSCSDYTGPAPGGSCGPCAPYCWKCATSGQYKCDTCLTGYTLNTAATTPTGWCTVTASG